MAKSRPVTERDLRMEEFRWLEAEDLEHLEIREDGKIVRKDRWENGIQSIRIALGDTRKEFEIPEIVSAVRALVRSIPVPAEESEAEESYQDIALAEMIMSDCGHSSDYTPLRDRIAKRIAKYVAERIEALEAPKTTPLPPKD